ncbi:RrF2 family transcriptional regulator [Parahaliea mediterranea]|uniref:Rrf2 family transcriptional regulator n=1 Tax=Parahaliea mediterranea TaxID=651086 RepID=A0A939IM13_9GAMM|nr:Rrf2 family transcriptional regulator [Parahaliea mediterranea]MBN7796532.1 Rrf2 family transcriptional regulator [Parahaliea mediterranea]
MRVTRHTDYALRVLIYVALKNGEAATIGEIAERYAISRNHLTKVVHRLARCGYLLTTRGKSGGLRLTRSPEMISLGAVFRDMESELGVVECMGGAGSCILDGGCELKKTFARATAAFLEVLDQQSLADLLPAREARRLRELLAIAP